MNKRLTAPSEVLLNKLQIASITGTNLVTTREEAAELFRVLAALRIYHLTKGLPDELVALIERS